MIENDIRESLQKTCLALNRNKVEYMLIGGVAVGFHGYQRISGSVNSAMPELKHDLDFWYNPTTSNYYNLVNALKELGVNTERLEELVFDPNKTFLKIPHDSFKTEFLPQMKGLGAFQDCWKRARPITLDGNEIAVIGYDDLIGNKKAVNRDIDRKDIEELEKINKRRNE